MHAVLVCRTLALSYPELPPPSTPRLSPGAAARVGRSVFTPLIALTSGTARTAGNTLGHPLLSI